MFVFQILGIVIFTPLTIFVVMRQNLKIGFIFLVFVIVYSTLQVIFFNIMKKYEIQSNEKNSKMM